MVEAEDLEYSMKIIVVGNGTVKIYYFNLRSEKLA
jgi:hypothetical protein